jgi:hypothetical protein
VTFVSQIAGTLGHGITLTLDNAHGLSLRGLSFRRRPPRGMHVRNTRADSPPGDEAWLIGEHRISGEKKYYLANLPVKTELRILAATIKARWICEQAHQQMKEELGLDHFEGRSSAAAAVDTRRLGAHAVRRPRVVACHSQRRHVLCRMVDCIFWDRSVFP